MTSIQESKLKMYLTLRILLGSNASIIATLPHCDEFIAALDAAILQIKDNDKQHHRSSDGETVSKTDSRDTLVEASYEASQNMIAFAKYAKNTVLLGEVSFTHSVIRNFADLELVTASQTLYDRIQENISNLAVYNFTADSQIAYLAEINDFADAIPHMKEVKIAKKDNTKSVADGYDAADQAIENIDGVVEIVHATQPAFYNLYQSTRDVNYHSGSLMVHGQITDATTKAGLSGVILAFLLNGVQVLEKITAEGGGFMIKSLDEGTYTVTISKLGYITQTITLNVLSGETEIIHIGLVKS